MWLCLVIQIEVSSDSNNIFSVGSGSLMSASEMDCFTRQRKRDIKLRWVTELGLISISYAQI